MLTNHSDSIASAATSAVRCGFIAETFHCMTQTDAAPPMVPSDDLAALIIRANETSAAFDAAYERLDAAKDAVDARVPRPEILGLDQDGPDTLTRLQRDGDRLATDFIVALFPLDAAGRAASEADFKRKFAELRASLSEVKAYIEGVTEGAARAWYNGARRTASGDDPRPECGRSRCAGLSGRLGCRLCREASIRRPHVGLRRKCARRGQPCDHRPVSDRRWEGLVIPDAARIAAATSTPEPRERLSRGSSAGSTHTGLHTVHFRDPSLCCQPLRARSRARPRCHRNRRAGLRRRRDRWRRR